MDKITLRDAVYKLSELSLGQSTSDHAYDQAAYQFTSLLEAAKSIYPDRADILAMKGFTGRIDVYQHELKDSILRLKHAIDLRPLSSPAETFAQINLPPDAPDDVIKDMLELETAINAGLTKTALLLAGSITESLLLTRHPDKSNKGPGLSKLVQQARDQRLFGRDTLRNLETLIEYRDLIHPRAEARNQTLRNPARVSAAVTALKLLCSELEDQQVLYD